MRPRRVLLLIPLALSACSGPQRMLDAHGPAAGQVATLWWVLLGMAVLVSLLIPAALLYAVSRGRRRAADPDLPEINGTRLVIAGGVAMPLVLLSVALLYSYRLSSEVYPPLDMSDETLTIDITGHQFWWEVRYPQHDVLTANEFSIPVGRDVRLRIFSSDVIHSFWVPQLQGKIDMVPGRMHVWTLRADSAGVFRGQCAEYCGMGHALMALWLSAVPEPEFEEWLGARRGTAEPELDAATRRGRDVFIAAQCGQCHATRGGPAPPELASVAPSLADFAARRTLAAGRAPNTPANLAAWIRDPERVKPGSRMPGTRLNEADMSALVAYLYTLR